jgi:hypothetical protein
MVQAIQKRVDNKKCQNSLNYIAQNRSLIERFTSLEHFICDAFDEDEKQAKAMEYHLRMIRVNLVRELWGQEIYLSVGTIDELFYDVLLIEHERPVERFVEVVLENGLHNPGLVIYPLHSFGLLGLGIYNFFKKSSIRLNLSTVGIAVTPQNNNSKKTAIFLEDTRKAFKIKHKVPMDLLDHYRRSRDLRWLDQNPLLAVKVSSFSGTYYDNQFIFVLKLRLATALLMMMSAMDTRLIDEEKLSFSSSSRINNWQTFDLHHYLVLQAPVAKKKELDAKCVPMNANRLELMELSDLGTDLNPMVWRNASKRPLIKKLHSTLRILEKSYLRHCILGTDKGTVPARVYRKLLASINYFRRSFRAQGQVSENIVALAIALETLLTDAYGPGVSARIIRRVEICLATNPEVAVYKAAVEDLFQSRGAIVHHGEVSEPSSLWKARQAYILCFLELIQKLDSLPKKSSNPIGDLLKDTMEELV